MNTRILGIDPGTGICGFGVIEIKDKFVTPVRDLRQTLIKYVNK